MPTKRDLESIAQAGEREFAAGHFTTALEKFHQAADGYAALHDEAGRAEQMNNMSVTLLQLGRAQDALEAVSGTELVFAAEGDVRRQAIAMNNRAAALGALRRPDDAIKAYDAAAELLGQAGEGGLQSEALKAAAAIDLRRGRVASSGSKMLWALTSNPRPNLLERVLKGLLRRIS